MKRLTLHKLIFSILLFTISFLALFISHKSSTFADWYSSTIYPLFVSSIGRFFGIFPFSVSEIGLYIFVILLFLSLIRMLVISIYKMYAQKKNPAWLGYGSSLLLLCGCLFTIYTFFCGINYGHTSFAEKYHLEKTVVPVKGCRNIGKKDMKYNDRTPSITVNPETYEVRVNGEQITSKPAEKLPLTQIYNLF